MKTIRLFIFLVLLFVGTSVFAQQRIIGGSAIDITQRPFQVAIFIDGEHKGGGSIINNQWILTAAHLVDRHSTSLVSISIGHTNLNNDTQRKSVSPKIVHPNFNRETMKNDIALLKLSTPISFDLSKQPVCISNKNTYSSGTTAVVSGWGQTAPNIHPIIPTSAPTATGSPPM